MSQILVTGEAKIRDIQGPVVANSGVITALDGAASQYVRGDGTLADFPTSTGGGSSVSYYLNSSVSQGTIGGNAYRQLSKTPISGAGTDITASTNGYIANYITDANDPSLLEVPAGNFNCEFYFSVNSNNHNPYVYAELYKYDGTTFTLLGSNQAIPEYLANGTTLSAYYFAIPVAVASLNITDRLAIRIYANVDTTTVTLHTENNHLCQVVTTFSKGLTSLNNLTRQVQFLGTGTSGTDFNIASSVATHTFNLPVASATNTGKLSSTDWSTFNAKQAALSFTAPLVNTSNTISIPAATSLVDGYLDNLDWVNFNTAYNDSIISAAVTGTTTKTLTLNQQDGGTITASWTDINTDAVTSVFGRTGAVVAASGDYTTTQVTEGTNLYFTNLRAQNAITLTTTGTSGAATYSGGTLNIPQYQGVLTNPVTGTGTTNTLPKFTGTSTIGNSNITDSGSLITLGSNVTTTGSQFVQNGFYLTNTNGGAIAGYTNMWGADDGIFFGLRNATGGAKFVFQSATSYNYTFPAATGTLALTSNLSDYLPLTGGTLTGGLSGTTATFSGLGTFYQLTMTGATAGRIFYAQTGGVVSQSGNLNWNETNGMLGVGTPNPSAVITAFSNNAATQFKAAGTAPAFTFSQSLTTSTYACVFGLATSANHFITGTAAGDMAIANQSATAGAIVFGTGTAEKMRMSAAGNFGIGTIPSAWGSIFSNGILQVKTSSLLSYNNNTYLTTNGYFTNSGDNYIGNGFASRYIQTSGNHIWENAPNNTSGADAALTLQERMRITSGGNVGIGTSSPNTKLSIQNDGASVYANSGWRNTSSTAELYVGVGGSSVSATFAQNNAYIVNAGASALVFGTSDTERMRITSDGKALFGTSTAGYGLFSTQRVTINPISDGIVVGPLPQNNSAYTTQAGDNTGTRYALYIANGSSSNVGSISFTSATTSYNITSDYRLKQDLKEFNGLSILSKVKTYDFEWKIDNSRMYGVIAHELQDVIPYAVLGEKDGEQMQSVDYSKLVPVLVKAIQEQQAQIEELKALILNK